MSISNSGDAVQVALIDNAIAAAYARSAEAGNFILSGREMNPLDPFSASAHKMLTGVAMVIVNCVHAPLTLIDTYLDLGGSQLSYPASLDPKTQKMAGKDIVPAARPYPRKEKHLQPNGDPLLMAGLGVYRFDCCGPLDWAVQMSMKFSYKANLGGPFVGVAFRSICHQPAFQNPYFTGESAVTADADGNFSDLKTFYKQTVGADKTNPRSTGSLTDPVTICAAFQDQNAVLPTAETGMLTLRVCVRDPAWK